MADAAEACHLNGNPLRVEKRLCLVEVLGQRPQGEYPARLDRQGAAAQDGGGEWVRCLRLYGPGSLRGVLPDQTCHLLDRLVRVKLDVAVGMSLVQLAGSQERLQGFGDALGESMEFNIERGVSGVLGVPAWIRPDPFESELGRSPGVVSLPVEREQVMALVDGGHILETGPRDATSRGQRRDSTGVSSRGSWCSGSESDKCASVAHECRVTREAKCAPCPPVPRG